MTKKKTENLTLKDLRDIIKETLDPDLKHEVHLDKDTLNFIVKVSYNYKWIPKKCARITAKIYPEYNKNTTKTVIKGMNDAMKKYITSTAINLLQEQNIVPAGWLTVINLNNDFATSWKDKTNNQIYNLMWRKYKDTSLYKKTRLWPSCTTIDEIYKVQSSGAK